MREIVAVETKTFENIIECQIVPVEVHCSYSYSHDLKRRVQRDRASGRTKEGKIFANSLNCSVIMLCIRFDMVQNDLELVLLQGGE